MLDGDVLERLLRQVDHLSSEGITNERLGGCVVPTLVDRQRHLRRQVARNRPRPAECNQRARILTRLASQCRVTSPHNKRAHGRIFKPRTATGFSTDRPITPWTLCVPISKIDRRESSESRRSNCRTKHRL